MIGCEVCNSYVTLMKSWGTPMIIGKAGSTYFWQLTSGKFLGQENFDISPADRGRQCFRLVEGRILLEYNKWSQYPNCTVHIYNL